MTALARLDALISAMPPAGAMGIRVAAREDGALRLHAPLSANLNDKGCAFGGSLASIMTLAAWGWAMLALEDAGLAADVYVADSQVRYLAPLYADLQAEAHLRPDQDWDAALRALRERGRARASLLAEVRAPDGLLVATLEARFALLRTPPAAAPG